MRRKITLSEEESAAEFQRVSKDLLVHDADQGVNYWAGSPYPTMLIWAGRIFEFLRVLEDIVGFLPARRHSYTVGYRSGWDGAAVNERLLAPAAEDRGVQLLLSGAKILAGAGWGRCEIEYDEEEKSVRWMFPRGTAFGLAAKLDGPRENPACPFMAGFVAGWTNRSLGLEIEVREVECVGKGEARCAFESTEFIRFKQ